MSSSRISNVTVVGSGPSSAVPILKCFVANEEKPCVRCLDGLHNPDGKNERYNPSLFIQISSSSSSSLNKKNIILDCGKTMRNSILKFFYPRNIRQIDEVIITHDHADAYLGILDLAPLLNFSSSSSSSAPVPLYSDEKTIKKVKEVFPNVFGDSSSNGNSSPNSFDFSPMSSLSTTHHPVFEPKIVTPGTKFTIGGGASSEENGVEVLPIYVLHGVNYYCLAFIFSLEPNGKLYEKCQTLVYISDTGDVTDASRNLILQYTTKILILDLLKVDEGYISHFGHEAAVAEAKKIGATDYTYFIGTSHSVDRDRCEKNWKENEGLNNFVFAHDGLEVFNSCSSVDEEVGKKE